MTIASKAAAMRSKPLDDSLLRNLRSEELMRPVDEDLSEDMRPRSPGQGSIASVVG